MSNQDGSLSVPAEPDLGLIANHLVEISDHVIRCQALPSVDNGTAVLRAINLLSDQMGAMQSSIQALSQLSEQVSAMQTSLSTMQTSASAMQTSISTMQTSIQTINNKVDRVDSKVDDLQQELTTMTADLNLRIRVSDHNTRARLDNNTADKEKATIAPLLNIHTGEAIERFPATAGEALKLSNAEVTRILGELGMSRRGTIKEKKPRMMLAIGVINRSAFGHI